MFNRVLDERKKVDGGPESECYKKVVYSSRLEMLRLFTRILCQLKKNHDNFLKFSKITCQQCLKHCNDVFI